MICNNNETEEYMKRGKKKFEKDNFLKNFFVKRKIKMVVEGEKEQLMSVSD